jgi:uncharacterized protein YigA (DUF484 family)
VTTPFADRAPAPAVSETPPSAAAVEAFLVANPAFLAERPHLFRVLEPPRRVHGERIADHMAAMLGAERRRARVLEAEIDAAAAAGRAGQGLNFRVRLAVLALMRCTDVVETVSHELPALLGIEACTLVAEAPDRFGVLPLPPGTVRRLLTQGRDAIVRPHPTDIPLLHAEAAPLVARDALVRVPLWTGQPCLLTLGARDAQALPARQSAATLSFLGRAVAAAMAR